jgi:hypothetical protein
MKDFDPTLLPLEHRRVVDMGVADEEVALAISNVAHVGLACFTGRALENVVVEGPLGPPRFATKELQIVLC